MAKFSKVHYEALALTMQRAHPQEHPLFGGNVTQEQRAAWQICCNEVAAMLQKDNVNFGRERFILACSPGNNVRARS